MFRRNKRPPQPTPDPTTSDPPRAAQPPSGVPEERSPAIAGDLDVGAPEGGAAKAPAGRRRTSAAERQALLAEFAASPLTQEAFAAQLGIAASTLRGWLKRARVPREVDPRFARRFTPEERRAAVEAFQRSGRKREDFARLWDCSPSSLDKWVRRYRVEGPRGLEDRNALRARWRLGLPVRPETARDLGRLDGR